MCYANSKLLLMMFCGELQRRLRSAGSTIDCMSAHPGISSTDIFRKEDKSKPSANVLNVLGNGVLARIQPPERGCHSMLYAATEPSLTGESLLGAPLEQRYLSKTADIAFVPEACLGVGW